MDRNNESVSNSKKNVILFRFHVWRICRLLDIATGLGVLTNVSGAIQFRNQKFASRTLSRSDTTAYAKDLELWTTDLFGCTGCRHE
jgi:hypothetical protein